MMRLQRGFTLVAAIFLIVVLAVLGIYMITISGTQHQTYSLAAQGAQGYFAARAGTEWGAYQALETGGGCNGTHAFASFSVEVSCSSSTHTITGDDDVIVWSITSTATKGAFGDRDHVSRTLTITVAN